MTDAISRLLGGLRFTLRSKRMDRPLDPEGKAIRDRLSLATPRAIANLERLMAL